MEETYIKMVWVGGGEYGYKRRGKIVDIAEENGVKCYKVSNALYM